jgi:hypothetical protein
MHAEYRHLFATTDFNFVHILKQKFASGLPLSINPATDLLDSESVRFGTNHDLHLNPPELVSGLLFASREQTVLAICLSLLIADGTALVFAEDAEGNERSAKMIRQCVQYRRTSGGLSGILTITKSAKGWLVTNGEQSYSLE